MAGSKKYEPPKATAGDYTHTVVRAGLGAIPLVGTAATELFRLVVEPPLDRRRQVWMEEVGESLRKLDAEKGVRLEDLRENDTFIDIVLQASQAAMRTSHEEKRKALRNAIMNSALPHSPDEARQHFFIRLIDELSARHLQVLKIFQDPLEWAKANKHDTPIIVGDNEDADLARRLAFPDMGDERPYAEQIWRDLHVRGLVKRDSFQRVFGPAKNEITVIAHEFLRYIKEPV
ncbi:MAG: hypothetical protein C4520_06040 [Candidatus Abyssobacteria bacterium SURF_5]|uniref:Uncharacterized protein n=1 Tax=Abyssobacteria bacterium (strain SURF_5) TaxID=2093360 RepID=A0A3A4P6B7_ABYX5|nr:MAG: hypothetical protein C4520_06040 [Candidatus Abyssubacteria bacterium SURF_5]